MADPIRYWTAPCALGHLLLAAGERGITQLRFGDSPGALTRAFLAAFPEAQLARERDPLRGFCAQVVACLARWNGRGAPPELPLDRGLGTPFERRVWDALREIPAGEVRHYADVARAIGRPRAARAVASACAKNPFAWLVPCHRVVPRSGGIGGYRWGRERKRSLLEREGALAREPGSDASGRTGADPDGTRGAARPVPAKFVLPRGAPVEPRVTC